ncbi:MAG TPA: hypothetical protein VGL38_12865 [bacterium]|jgi:hypothetical protein
MNDTRYTSPPFRPRWRARSARRILAAAAVLGAISLWALNWGCSDPRHEPLAPAEPGYTETINLWNNTSTGTDGVAPATFSVAQQLATVNVPGVSSPARLTVATYIQPDCQIYRRLQIMQDSVPYIRDSLIVPALVALTNFKTPLIADTVVKARIDSVEAQMRVLTGTIGVAVSTTDSLTQFTYHGRTTQCDSALYRVDIANAASVDSALAALRAGFAAVNDTLAQLEMQFEAFVLDTTRLGQELVYLNTLLDNRYILSVALDSTSTFYVPNAVYVDSAGRLGGQAIYAAAIDSATGYIGRGFTLPLDRLPAADISHLGRTFEVNWAVCFPGSDRPCLSPGPHTLYVRIPGRNARVTGTIVLVYAQRT